MKEVFVFGSNLAGLHGAGSALEAQQKHGAKTGLGVGISGNSYAIPTKDSHLEVLPLEVIKLHVEQFLSFAEFIDELNQLWLEENDDNSDESPYETKFNVVPIGCGLAGYKFEQIAPMFTKAPCNVEFLNADFRDLVSKLAQLEEGVGHSSLSDDEEESKQINAA